MATSSARTPSWPKPVKTSVTCSASSSIITTLPGPREPLTSSMLNDASSQPVSWAIVRHSRSAMCRGRLATMARTRRATIWPRSSKFQAAELLRRLDADGELPAAGRIEARADKLHLDLRPQPVHQRQICLLQEIHRRGQGVVRAALQGQVRLALGQQERGQHGLQARGSRCRPCRRGRRSRPPGPGRGGTPGAGSPRPPLPLRRRRPRLRPIRPSGVAATGPASSARRGSSR